MYVKVIVEHPNGTTAWYEAWDGSNIEELKKAARENGSRVCAIMRPKYKPRTYAPANAAS